MGWEVSAAKSAATASAASGAAATTGSSAFLGRLFSRSSALSRAREDPADALECEIPPTSHPALRLAPTAVPSSASAAFDEGWRCRAPRPALPKTRVWSGSATGRDARKRGQTRPGVRRGARAHLAAIAVLATVADAPPSVATPPTRCPPSESMPSGWFATMLLVVNTPCAGKRPYARPRSPPRSPATPTLPTPCALAC